METPDRDRTRPLRASAAVLVLLGLALAGGCGRPGAPEASPTGPGSESATPPMSSIPPPTITPTPSRPPTSPSVPPATLDRVSIDITIRAGQVRPNGQKLDVAQGSTVVLTVTSDTDDEIHAHTGGDGYELEVPAGKQATGSFAVTEPGSFEVESHHLGKIIVILNVR